MNRNRICAIGLLLATPFMLGVDGAVLCVCHDGVHVEAPHGGACPSCRAADCADSEPGDAGQPSCGHDRACTDIPLDGPGSVVPADESAKRLGRAPGHEISALASARECLATPFCGHDTLLLRQNVPAPLLSPRSRILLI